MKLFKHHAGATRSRSAATASILLFLLTLLVALALGNSAGAAPAATGVPLGTADSFAVLGASTVTNTGPSVVTGDLGLSPGTAVTGFPPGIVLPPGTIHVADAVALQAQNDTTIAYNDAAGQAPTSSIVADLGGQTLVAGVYNSAISIGLTGTLTLDGQGDPSSVWVFQAGSTLTTASGSLVSLINGAQSCNVFWQVGSSATLGTGSTFRGTILALTSITATTGATVDGRLLARNGAVTLDTNTITKSTCAPPPQPPPPPEPPPPPPPLDETPPICVLIRVEPGPPTRLFVRAQDSGSGLGTIVVTESVNATVSVPPFTPGTTGEVIVTGTKINQSRSARVGLRVTDVAGNVTLCDPVLATLKIRKAIGRNGTASGTYRGLPRAESKVQLINGRPGVKSVELIVNGKRFKTVRLAPGARRMINVARAMKPGNRNRIKMIARGARGASVTVVISD